MIDLITRLNFLKTKLESTSDKLKFSEVSAEVSDSMKDYIDLLDFTIEQVKETSFVRVHDELKFLEACREYDASGINRPEGYILPKFYLGKRQS